VYVWADGVHFNIRLEEDRLAALVVVGVRPDGTKEVVAIEDGYRESTESWLTLLRDLRARGMRAPVLSVGDGALGFWAALRQVWPATREQRCWFHKLGNVLDSCRGGCSRKPSASCTRPCTPRRSPTPRRRSRASSTSTAPSTRRPSSA
jgi:transposase-like protein